ncbi:hypothetical protein BKA65DRAFT_190865 [Rhexocercosporidium sp. MPI-PUGE-AT-0058]|nr:hypothetical protein BKA65DRAFT_190865 [Rhexocercosporidium sp. MPI-PUGE-AT-0058]
MSDISSSPSPSKRRRTKGNLTLATNSYAARSPEKREALSGPSEMEPEGNSRGAWPPNKLPVELFTLIVSYLPRSGVQNMRLINKEFDRKVSEALFRIVVLPFKPEIYGITPETTGSNDIPHGSIMLQDQGMRVFQGFGRWIKRFAMSFEIDHTKLASPPQKSDQEVILSFWGPYRWPFKAYNRYSQLEGLEQTADETRTMAKALKYICYAKELGLSIDGGLGWLAGPDINQRVAERGEKLVVFGASKFVPEAKFALPKGPPKLVIQKNSAADQSATDYARYLRMVLEAGIPEGMADEAVRMLQADDRAGGTALLGDDIPPDTAQIPQTADPLRVPRRRQIVNPNNALMDLTEDLTEMSDEDGDGEASQAAAALSLNNTRKGRPKSEAYPLRPNDLTNAQREMLLEMEWAQNAFMQSWAIAIMDNHSTFGGIEKLNIARLPSRHLSILRREDFWDSLSSLKCLSLAIIPDWREVKKEATSWVQDTRVAPSQAVTAVYDMLTQQIGRREHIKELHFEWLCGGEYAPGLFARNQNILAAPVVEHAMHMVNRSQQPPVLDLPHIEHLSLKNCWISPHVLCRFLGPMRQRDLQSISLDSVSLTAKIPQNANPNPLTQAAVLQNAQNVAGQGAANGMFFNMQALQNGVNGPALQLAVPPVAAPNPNVEPAWLKHPRAGSWADIINNITPGTTLEDIRQLREFGPEPEPKKPTKLSKLIFKSCGYVRLPLDFDQTALEPTVAPLQTAALTKRIAELDGQMMKPLEAYTMATIINHIDPVEVEALENAWNMTVGWRLSRPDLANDAQLDGFSNAGQGRFDGLIEVA